MDQSQWLSQKMLRLSLKLMVGNTFLSKMVMILEAIAKKPSKKLRPVQINHLSLKLRHHWLWSWRTRNTLSTVLHRSRWHWSCKASLLKLWCTGIYSSRWSCSSFWAGIKFRGEVAENAWQTKFVEYEAAYPELSRNTRLPLQMNLYTQLECSWLSSAVLAVYQANKLSNRFLNKFLHSGEVQQTFQLLTILWLRLSLGFPSRQLYWT